MPIFFQTHLGLFYGKFILFECITDMLNFEYMRIVFLSYHYNSDIRSPREWTERIKFYIGWSELLAETHTIIRVDQINYEGSFVHNNIQYHCINTGKKNNFLPWKLHRKVKSL